MEKKKSENIDANDIRLIEYWKNNFKKWKKTSQ